MIGLLILIILLALAYHVYTCCMPKKTRMIWFYRDDCGHCVRMKPEWNKFESIYNGANVTIEKINIYEYADFAN
jgi:thiol-disulfide isomerase/thioredoxin